MKRKLFTFLVAFLATLSGAVWGQEQTPKYTALTDNGHLKITDSNDHYYTTNGVETNFYFVIDGNYSPKIHIKDMNITTGGAAFEILGGAEVTLIIDGVNTITSNGNDAAIKVTVTSELTIHSSSTGILTINVPSSDDYAIGDNSALGCGTINIEGGTIKTNGTIGNGLWHGVRLNNSAILISEDVTGTGDNNDLAHGGIYFGEGNTTGKIVDEAESFTLKSPVPEGYTIDMDNKPFTVGEGGSVDVDKIVNASVINAYKVSYKESTDTEINNYTHNALPSTKYVGAKYIPETWDANESTTQTDTKYQVLEGYWLNADNQLVKAGEKTTASEPAGEVAVQYTAIWTLSEKNLIYSEDEGLSTDGSFRLWVPASAPLSASENTSDDGSSLASVGLQQSNGSISKASELNITETGEKTVFMNLNSGSTNIGTSTINITIQEKEKDNISTENSKATFTFLSEGSFEYEGKPIDDSRVVSCTYGESTPITLSAHFTVSYSTDNGKTWTATLQDVVEGGYKVKVTAKDESSVFEGEKVLDGTVSITPKPLTVAEGGVKDETYVIDGDEVVDYTDNITKESITGIVENDNLTIICAGSINDETAYLTPGKYTVNYTITLDGEDKTNYEEPTNVTGNLIVKVIGSTDDPISDKDENPLIAGAGDWANGSRTYDGKRHNLTQIATKYDGKDDAVIDLSNVTITYSYKQSESSEPIPATEVKDAGIYTATFTFPENEYGYEGSGEVTLTITKADLTISVSTTPQVTVGTNLEETEFQAAAYLTASSNVEGEDVNFNGNLTLKDNVSAETEGTIEDAFSHENVTLVADEVTGSPFKESNYNVKWPEKIGLEVGKITLDPDPDGDGNEDITGGEDTNNDGQLDENDFILITSDDTKLANSVYDGQSHELAKLEIGGRTLTEDVDYMATYSSTDEPSVNEKGLPLHAADYIITVTLKGAYQFADNTTEKAFNAAIAQRPMTITFVDEVSSLDDLKDINKLVQCDGIVKGEWPEISATITAKAMGNNRYSVSITSISISNSNSFYLSDYKVKVDTDGDGVGDEEITDEDGDGSGVWEGDGDDTIDIVITVNPGKDDDDDDHNPGHGGSTGGINRPAKYYNIYVDTAATSDGVELSLSKDVVKEGNQVSVYIDKILEGYNAENMKVQIKRSLYGYWEEIEESVQPGEYVIYNIYHDIYVKVTDVVKDDATGIEDVEGVKAYAKDGSIYVYTPNREEVTIISMSGAIIKHEEQVGLQSYSVSRGIYIVRIGDKVFKLKN